ncbi:MAG: DUF2306 domain-containing protein [Saprospiraceae bacterium]
MKLKFIIYLFAFLAISIGLYPLVYLFIDETIGLFSGKPASLLADRIWNFAFYTHIGFGGLSLLSGWSQFLPSFRKRKLNLHRSLGKIYVISVLISALAGIYIGFFASTGLIASLGFITLGIIWFGVTLAAFLTIKKGQIQQHQIFMVFSYAATFAAVTLRLWMPILIGISGSFEIAYPIVAWLCWVPNLIFAWWWVNFKMLSLR